MNDQGQMDTSGHHPASFMPDYWTWEKFVVRYLQNGDIALHSTVHNRFIRMTETAVDATGPWNMQDLNSDVTHEKFRILKLSDAPSASSPNDQTWSFDVD
mmetsp:Transcript_35347/g.65825  ORF Transcript_35347/g.65825 Transcript_35347/m.65825 type:complete len:100 (+) Transcript_35347:196-495(+)